MTKRKRGYRRGYPVAVLVGLGEKRAVLWNVFSEVVKPHAVLEFRGRRAEEAGLYSFHESIVNALRPTLKEGIRSVAVVAPARTSYAKEFLDHAQKHHAWLAQNKGSGAATFGTLAGSAGTLAEVAELVKTQEYRRLISETTSSEADNIVETLEKRLNSSAGVLFSLSEIEELISSKLKNDRLKPEYLMLTDRYLTESREKNRTQRLLQIAKNQSIRTRIINADTPAGRRLSQFGGLVCFTEPRDS